jgi:hypothetical protein
VALLEELIFARSLSQPQRHRAHVLTHQGLPQNRNSYNRLAQNFLAAVLSRRNRLLLVMTAIAPDR